MLCTVQMMPYSVYFCVIHLWYGVVVDFSVSSNILFIHVCAEAGVELKVTYLHTCALTKCEQQLIAMFFKFNTHHIYVVHCSICVLKLLTVNNFFYVRLCFFFLFSLSLPI